MIIIIDPKRINYLLNKLTVISKSRFVQLIADAEKQTICFRGANESVQIITCSIECEVDKSGACGFDYFVLKDLISSLRSATSIILKCSESNIQIENIKTKGKYNVESIPADGIIVELKQQHNLPKVSLSIDSGDLNKSLACVLKAAPKNDARWYLNGINFEYNSELEEDGNIGPILTLVATDGHRLNVRKIKVIQGFGIDSNFVIPNNPNNPFIDYLMRVTSLYTGEITIKFSDVFAEIVTPEGDSIRTKLLEHNYINWKQFLNSDVSQYSPITFDRGDFQSILNRFKTITLKFDLTCIVKVDLNKDGVMNLLVHSTNNVISASEFITVDNPAELEFSVAFNSQYMLDLLTVETLESATVWFDKTDPTKKVIRYTGTGTTGIIVPVRQ